MIKLARIALFAAACAFVPLSASAAPATKAEAESIVQTAAAFAAKNGEDKLVAEVNNQGKTNAQTRSRRSPHRCLRASSLRRIGRTSHQGGSRKHRPDGR